MLKSLVLAGLFVAPLAKAKGTMRDLFGMNMCAHLPAQYQLQKGDAACPRLLSIKRDPMDFVVAELGIRASFSNAEYLTDTAKGKLGGESGRVFRRVGQIDCGEVGLACQGMVDIARITKFDWNDSCSELALSPTKRYSQSGLFTGKVLRTEAITCLYRQ